MNPGIVRNWCINCEHLFSWYNDRHLLQCHTDGSDQRPWDLRWWAFIYIHIYIIFLPAQLEPAAWIEAEFLCTEAVLVYLHSNSLVFYVGFPATGGDGNMRSSMVAEENRTFEFCTLSCFMISHNPELHQSVLPELPPFIDGKQHC